jgi:hypothetical protein
MKEDSLKRIETDLKTGKKFIACDKLRNLINENPNEFKLREKLAEIYYESGFYDRAGLFWILTEPKNDEIKKCQEIYLSTVNNSGDKILKDFQFRGDENLLSEYAKTKFHKLQTDSFEKTGNVPIYKEKPKYSNRKSNIVNDNSKFPTIIFFSIIITIIILILLGLYKLLEIVVK